MPYYQKRGKVPGKRHITFRKPDGSLYAEEVVSTEGFSNIYSIIYHEHPPTKVLNIDKPYSVAPEVAVDENMQNRSFRGFDLKPVNDFLESRKTILFNSEVYISLAAPRHSMTDYFYKNSQADEMIFIHEGEGVLKTVYGELAFVKGDHLIIPRGTVYQLAFKNEHNRLFIVESFYPLNFPKRYMNNSGQLLEHSPFYERDIKTPEKLVTRNETGDFLIKIKRSDHIYPYHYATHPFDAIGWDGHLYPFALSIYDFEPLTGRIHQPPPVHQTFETPGFVTCAFVPRLYDYHPQAIPAPYHHSNVDSDEVLYYVDGDFMSRNDIQRGQITLHPIGIPHGPHPGAIERSIGKKGTDEYAVMVDTFKPLKLTKTAMEIEVKDYFKSWLE
ncbi:MAG: homogentisate 1,2-dioxygenase [Chlorobi bacterium]|nr:homogentisate 1,2-dioxygenase [Chlorobiota bacterium]